jgi:hypothetical protein
MGHDVPEVIMVLGIHKSGTSCMAGMLASLGLPMGKSGIRANRKNPKGYFECRLLRKLMIRCGHVEFPNRAFTVPFRRRVRLLRKWRLARSANGPRIGAKLPAMGNMVPELHAAFEGKWKVIVTERPIADSVKSRQYRRAHHQSAETITSQFTQLATRRDTELRRLGVAVLRVDFATMMQSPALIVDQLIAFVGLSPTAEQRAQAIAFVEPKLNHFSELG